MKVNVFKRIFSVLAGVSFIGLISNSVNAESFWEMLAEQEMERDAYIYYDQYTCEILEDGSLEIIDYEGDTTGISESVVIIPEQIEGRTVTSIGDRAFQDCAEVTSIKIPDTVIHIGDYAFELCRGMNNIRIPDSVTSMGANPFVDCEHLTQIIVSPKHPTFAVIGSALFEKEELRLIAHFNINNDYAYSIPQGIEIIGESAFARSYMLSDVEIPESVKYIEDHAFAYCGNLKEIIIPDTVEYIGAAPFENCTLDRVVVSPEHTGYGTKNGMLFSVRDNTLIGYINRENVGCYSIPDGVNAIGDYAFASCSSLQKIEIPNSVTYIGKHAFEDCHALNRIVIPESIERIEEYTFFRCMGLLSVKLPETVTSIGERAFSGCGQLTELNLLDNVVEIGEDAFSDDYCLMITISPESEAEKYCKEYNVQYKFEEDDSWLPEYISDEDNMLSGDTSDEDDKKVDLYQAAVERYYSMSPLDMLRLYTDESRCTDEYTLGVNENEEVYNEQFVDDGGYFDEIVTGAWYDEYGVPKADMIPDGLLDAVSLFSDSFYVGNLYFIDGERYTLDLLRRPNASDNYFVKASLYTIVITDIRKINENGYNYIVGNDYISNTDVVISGDFDKIVNGDDLLVIGSYSGMDADDVPHFKGYYVEIITERGIGQDILGYDGEITLGIKLIMNMIEEELKGEYLIPDSHIRKLSYADLDGMDSTMLRLVRNEIYARHGRIFTSEDLKEHFQGTNWYHGTRKAENFDESILSEVERYNVDLIMELEIMRTVSKVTYFSMTMGTSEEMNYMSAYDDEAGGVYVDYVGDEKKVGTLDIEVLKKISSELAVSGLPELNGLSVYEEGNTMASMYIQYDDGTYLTADFSGEIAEAFIAGYETMDKLFQSLTEELPVYVAQPMIMGAVNEDALAAITEVLEVSDIENLDSLAITDVPLDENFEYSMGLSGSDGIVNGTSCTTMMMTSAYSFVIATVEDKADIKAVRKDFEESMDWYKWICIMPSDALIAQKDNMVVCVMGDGEMFQKTADAIKKADWTEIRTWKNPDLQ